MQQGPEFRVPIHSHLAFYMWAINNSYLRLYFPFLAPLNTSLHCGIGSTGKVRRALAPDLRRLHRGNGNPWKSANPVFDDFAGQVNFPAFSSKKHWWTLTRKFTWFTASWFTKESTDPNCFAANRLRYWSEIQLLIFPRNSLVNTTKYSCERKRNILISRL